MTDDVPDPAPKRNRRFRRWLMRAITLLALLLIAAIVALAYPPGGREITLPDWARARIEARIDAAMPGGEVTVRAVGVRLSRDRMLPQVLFTDMALNADGQQRILLPRLGVSIDPGSALRGQIRPRHIRVAGAGLTLSRDADGSLDLAFAGGGAGTERDLAETLAGIDAMFAQPVFEHLGSVTADGADLQIADDVTGEVLEVEAATLSLLPFDDALTLAVGGTIAGADLGRLDLSFTRWAARAETEIVAGFDNVDTADVASVSDALAWLGLIDAPISGQMRTVIRDDGSVGHLTGALGVGAGHLRAGEGAEPFALTALSLRFDYDAAARRLEVEELVIDAPRLSTSISGHADLMEGPVYVAQLRMGPMEASLPGLMADPVRFDGGALDMRLQVDPDLRVDLGQLVLFAEALHLSARGHLAVTDAGLALSLDAHLPEIAARDILPLWPLVAIPATRDWLEANLLAGTARDLNAALRLAPGQDPQIGLTFDFDGATVRALQRMAPVEGGHGYLTLADNAMVLALDGGHITAPDGGALELAGSTMRIADTRVLQSETSFDLQIGGQVPSALTLIGAEPLNLLEAFPFDPATVASGEVALEVGLQMVLAHDLTPADVDFRIAGTLRNVLSDELVEGRVLRAAALDVDADNTRLEIGGAARLDGLQATASWSRALGPGSGANSRIEGTATLTAEALAQFGVGLPQGMLRGQGFGDFTLALARGQAPRLTLQSDLAGIGLAIPALGWRLPSAQTGRLLAEVTLGEAPTVPRLEVSGAGLVLEGAVALQGTAFSSLDLDRFALADWIEITGSLRLQEGRPRIIISGGEVDLRGLPSDAGATGNTATIPMQIALDRLRVTEGIYLSGLDASIGGSPVAGDFRGAVGGQAPVSGSILAERDGMSLRMRADDGGAVLRAAGIYDNAYGGAMDLILRPLAGQGNYSGLLTIDNPRLRDAPAFAELLSLVSVVGLIEQLATGEGVALGDVRADFRISPRAITIVEGTALGAAMGLSLEGVYDTSAEWVDFEGVVSPFYVVNGLMGAIFSPRREGLFGFTYRMTGPPDNSSVTVNPLSVFTPGIFREIFRSPPPETLQ